MRRFGEKLRALRTARDMTLAELSTFLGYRTHSYLSEIETGQKTPTAEFILKIADLFQVTTDQLMRDEIELIDHTQIHTKGDRSDK